MTSQETELQKRRHRKKTENESVNYTFDHDNDVQEYIDIETAWEHKEEAEYNTNELVKRKAEKIAESIEKDPNNTDQLREKLTHISEEMRHRVTNKDLRNYISHKLSS